MDKDLWLRRPLNPSLLTHSSYKILQLRTIYTSFLPHLSKHRHLSQESTRYTELYKQANTRPPLNAWYLHHVYLPQEILERSQETRERYDGLGKRTCAGCRRELHQDSFKDSFARRWTLRLGEHGKMCYTCSAARRRGTGSSSSSMLATVATGSSSTANPMSPRGPPSPTTP